MQGTSGQALAESIVLRGARQRGAPLQAAQAADLLDQSLFLEGAANMKQSVDMLCISLLKQELSPQERVLWFVHFVPHPDYRAVDEAVTKRNLA